MEIHISRDGEVIARVASEQLHQQVSDGVILAEDYAWYEGLPEWASVASLLSEIPKTAQPRIPRKKKASAPKHNYLEDPATNPQLKLLADLGIIAKAGITKRAASDLISQRIESQKGKRQDWQIEHKREILVSKQYPAQSVRLKIQKIESAVAALEMRIKAYKSLNAKNLSDSEKGDLADLAEEMKELKDELKQCKMLRLKFWKETFRQRDWLDDLGEDEEELLGYVDVINSQYAAWGQFFKTPTNKQITDLLAQCDQESSDWDSLMPETFYAFLNRLFPELMRTRNGSSKRALVSQKGKLGCLILLLPCMVIGYILHILY